MGRFSHEALGVIYNLFLKFYAVFILWPKKVRLLTQISYIIFVGFFVSHSVAWMQIGIDFDRPKHQILLIADRQKIHLYGISFVFVLLVYLGWRC